MSLRFIFTPYSDPVFGVKITFKTDHISTGKFPLTPVSPAEFPDIPTNDTNMGLIIPIMEQVIMNPNASYFLRAVDTNVDQAERYFEVITHPIDLGLIWKKAHNGSYTTFDQFSSDMKLLVDNAVKFNPSTHDVHQKALRLSFVFKDLLIQIEKNPDTLKNSQGNQKAENELARAILEFQKRKKDLQKQSEKAASEQNKAKTSQKPTKRVTIQEMEAMTDSIRRLRSSALIGVIEILTKKEFKYDHLPVEIDLSGVDEPVLEQLRVYIDECNNDSSNGSFFYAWKPSISDKMEAIRKQFEDEIILWKLPPPPSVTESQPTT